jgi:hypothetical protein
MKAGSLFMMGCLVLSLAPLLEKTFDEGPSQEAGRHLGDFHFQHYQLEPMAMPPDMVRAFKGFPGEVATFQSPGARWIVRLVTRPTRQLHPAAHCFRACGFSIGEPTIIRDPYESKWGTFTADYNQQTWRVYEQIREENGEQIWTDASAWYWDTLRRGGESRGRGSRSPALRNFTRTFRGVKSTDL